MNMPIKVFDFFSGCGGTSSGFAQAGFDVVCGLDCDHDSAETFKTNFPKATFFELDILEADVAILAPLIEPRVNPILFSGCAPCQPFSIQNQNKKRMDPRKHLLGEFSRFVDAWRPDYIFIENVPGLQKISRRKGPFNNFLAKLKELNYSYCVDVISTSSYGVPQTRKRLVLLASLHGEISLPDATHGDGKAPISTVGDWIADLPEVQHGQVHPTDKDHQAAALSERNLQRILNTPEGGNRNHWPKDLWLDCHKTHIGHSDVYGRLSWNKPAAALTTRCISYSNGRYGHPIQNRAISVREAACLQTFPRNYKFSGNLSSRARQIGNAVPPLLARTFGAHIQKHFLEKAASISCI